MAFSPMVLVATSLCFLSLAHLSFSATDVHDLLPQYNLPKGLLPINIKSYSLSKADDTFTIELSSYPCYVKFNDQLVHFDKIIKGKLGYGKVSEVSGIRAKKFFIWVPVTGIDVDQDNGMIEFHVGSLSQKLPAKDFEIIHSCKSKGLQELFSLMESSLI
ncbi:hypothetical protein CDL12_16453 [Handroanthus impetiginosus]|uniref:DUF538 domain-containing protein n=1 Tax=Handroanthus impetiginosus TaxID=429701 RepID=A0A2G9H0C5_9LAMI|nr:hypothetical protein CDL12_16453 [Handroanthus impetiginosus]